MAGRYVPLAGRIVIALDALRCKPALAKPNRPVDLVLDGRFGCGNGCMPNAAAITVAKTLLML